MCLSLLSLQIRAFLSSEDSLPDQLGGSKAKFLRSQDTVLTTAKDIELGIEGRHRYFDTSGDDHFWKLGFLGSGGSGDVEKVVLRLSLGVYARKRFRRPRITTREWVAKFKQFEREIDALKRLQHHHLVEIVGSYSDRLSLAFIMRLVADYNLLTFLQSLKGPDQLPALRSFYGCLASTVAYLHSREVYHMDIKLENILINNGDLYVADFGSAHDWSKKEQSTTVTNTPRAPWYQPPELAKYHCAPRNWATDIWSLGVVFLEMTSVLRGKSIQAFRRYLTENGTLHQYVFNNASATASWTEILRKCESPDFDNEPLMWIYGMTRPTAPDRPRASKLLELIHDSSAGEQFRRSCCSERIREVVEDSSNTSTLWQGFDEKDKDEDLLIQRLLESEQTPHSFQLQRASTNRSIEDWLSNEDSVDMDALDVTEDHLRGDNDLPFDLIEDGIGGVTSQFPFELTEDAISETKFQSFATPAIPERLRGFDVSGRSSALPGAWDDWDEPDEESMAYELALDDLDSDDSELTVKPIIDRKELVTILEEQSASGASSSPTSSGYENGSRLSQPAGELQPGTAAPDLIATEHIRHWASGIRNVAGLKVTELKLQTVILTFYPAICAQPNLAFCFQNLRIRGRHSSHPVYRSGFFTYVSRYSLYPDK